MPRRTPAEIAAFREFADKAEDRRFEAEKAAHFDPRCLRYLHIQTHEFGPRPIDEMPDGYQLRYAPDTGWELVSLGLDEHDNDVADLVSGSGYPFMNMGMRLTLDGVVIADSFTPREKD